MEGRLASLERTDGGFAQALADVGVGAGNAQFHAAAVAGHQLRTKLMHWLDVAHQRLPDFIVLPGLKLCFIGYRDDGMRVAK